MIDPKIIKKTQKVIQEIAKREDASNLEVLQTAQTIQLMEIERLLGNALSILEKIEKKLK